MSTAAASVLIIGVNLIFPGGGSTAVFMLSGAGLAISGLAVYVKVRLKKQYARSLTSLIKDRSLDLKQFAQDWKKADQSKLAAVPVETFLISGDETLYALVLDFIATVQTPAYCHVLREVLPQKSLDMQCETLKVLAAVDGEAHADYLLDTARGRGPSALRALAVDLLTSMKKDDIFDRLTDLIYDPAPEVQSAAIAAVCRLGDIFHMIDALSLLNGMLNSEDGQDFRRGAGIMVRIGDRRFIKTLAVFLSRKKTEFRPDIIRAMAALETGKDDRFLSHFHELIRTEAGASRGWAIDAAAKIGSESSTPHLMNGFSVMSQANRIKAVDALAAMGSAAASSLSSLIQDAAQPHEIRLHCLKQLLASHPRAAARHFKKVNENELVRIYTLMRLRMNLSRAGGDGALVRLVIGEMIGQSVSLWAHAASCKARKPVNVVMLAEHLTAGTAAARADAVEALENLIPKKHFRRIQPALLEALDEERLAMAEKRLPLKDWETPQLYGWAARNASSWHFACLLAVLNPEACGMDSSDVRPLLENALRRDDDYCAEAAFLAAAESGLGQELSALISPYLAHPGARLARTAQRALNPGKNGGPSMLSTFERVLFLKNVSIFRELDSEGLKILSGISTEAVFSKGEIIFEEGDHGDSMYVVEHGAVRLFFQAKPDQTLALLEKSDYFGEMAVLDGEPRSASAAAETDCRLMQIHRTPFTQLICDYPLISFPIFQALSRRHRQDNTKFWKDL